MNLNNKTIGENNVQIITHVTPELLRQFLETLDANGLAELQKQLHEFTMGELQNKLTPLPDFASEEFKIFDDRKNAQYSPKVAEIRKRRYVAFVYLYSHLDETDDQVIQFIRRCNPKLSYHQAIKDLYKVKNVIGDMPKVRKELIRHQVIEMHKFAYQRAKAECDIKAMVAAANGMALAANLDKDDPEIPWEEIIPPTFEPTSDLSALGEGFEHKENLEDDIERIKRKYGADVEEAKVVK